MPIDLNSTTTRSILAALLLLAGLVVGWFGHKALNAAPDLPTVTMYQDWRLACPPTSQKEASCEMQEDVLDSKSRTELARLSIAQVSGDTTLLITVPYNVLLGPGLGLLFGDDKSKPIILRYEICNAVGCLVRGKMDATLAQAFATASQARVLIAGLDGKPVALPFSMKGYADASAAFDSAEGRRHSWWRRLWS